MKTLTLLSRETLEVCFVMCWFFRAPSKRQKSSYCLKCRNALNTRKGAGQKCPGKLWSPVPGLDVLANRGDHSDPSLSLQGTHKSLKGNSRALSTVTAIIDGTGSVGKPSHLPQLQQVNTKHFGETGLSRARFIRAQSSFENGEWHRLHLKAAVVPQLRVGGKEGSLTQGTDSKRRWQWAVLGSGMFYLCLPC